MQKYTSGKHLQRKRKQNKFTKNILALILVLAVAFGVYKFIDTSSLFSTDPGEEAQEILNGSLLTTNKDIQPAEDIRDFEGDIVKTVNLEYKSFIPEMVQVPKNDPVDNSYFDDAVFVGDSLADGFRVYKTTSIQLSDSYTCITAISTTPASFSEGNYVRIYDNAGAVQTVHALTAIQQANPGKIYITLGTNALNVMSDEEFINSYYLFIDQLRTYLPETLIYVTSIPPATAVKVANDSDYALDRVYNINTQIAKMCDEKNLAFLNLQEVLKSSSGYLREEIASPDGLHLTPEGYYEWGEYLRTHTIYNPLNPYI